MLHWAEPNYPDYYYDRCAPPLPVICAYCGEQIASAAERGRHVSFSFRLPDCQSDKVKHDNLT